MRYDMADSSFCFWRVGVGALFVVGAGRMLRGVGTHHDMHTCAARRMTRRSLLAVLRTNACTPDNVRLRA